MLQYLFQRKQSESFPFSWGIYLPPCKEILTCGWPQTPFYPKDIIACQYVRTGSLGSNFKLLKDTKNIITWDIKAVIFELRRAHTCLANFSLATDTTKARNKTLKKIFKFKIWNFKKMLLHFGTKASMIYISWISFSERPLLTGDMVVVFWFCCKIWSPNIILKIKKQFHFNQNMFTWKKFVRVFSSNSCKEERPNVPILSLHVHRSH